MTYLAKLTLTAFTALALTACGNANETSNSETMDHSKMDHSQMGETKMAGDTGHTTGVIVSISRDRRSWHGRNDNGLWHRVQCRSIVLQIRRPCEFHGQERAG